jgi:hypothetical protein
LLFDGFLFLFLPLTQSFFTTRVEPVGSNLLVTSPVIPPCSFSLTCSCFCSTVALSSRCCCSFSLASSCFPSTNHEFCLKSTGHNREQPSSDSPSDFPLLFLFLFGFLFHRRFLFRLLLFFLGLPATISELCHWAARRMEQLIQRVTLRVPLAVSLLLSRSLPPLSLSLPLSPPETVSFSFPFLSLSRLIY